MKIKTKNKRRIYIFFSIILWVLLATIAYAFLEKAYINDLLLRRAEIGSAEDGLFLPPGFAVAFLLGGLIFGYVAGVRWWQIVYVERRHWRFRKKKV